MDDLCLLTPPEIAKKIGVKKTTDLTSGVKNLSASSLNNLKIANPTKYEIVMLGLIVKKLHINFNDLIFFSEALKFKNIKKNNSKMEYPISLETALAIVYSMKMKKIKEISNSKNPADESRLLQELDMYAEEEEMLYGFNDFVRLSVMDKVVRLYFPILKKKLNSEDSEEKIGK